MRQPIVILVAIACWVVGAVVFSSQCYQSTLTLMQRGAHTPLSLFFIPFSNLGLLLLAGYTILKNLRLLLEWLGWGFGWPIPGFLSSGAKLVEGTVDSVANLAGSIGQKGLNAAGQVAGDAVQQLVTTGRIDPHLLLQGVGKVLTDSGLVGEIEELTVKIGGQLHTLTPPQILTKPAVAAPAVSKPAPAPVATAAPPAPAPIQAVVQPGA